MSLAKRKSEILFDPAEEFRAAERTTLSLRGIIASDANHEQECLVLDLSCDGAGLELERPTDLGSCVVLQVVGLGQFEGEVVRQEERDVGIRFKSSKVLRGLISEQIANYLKFGAPVKSSGRDSDRLKVVGIAHSFVLKSGQTHECEIVDIALCGALFKAAVQPAVGESVSFGKSAAVVVRHTKAGFAVKFL